MVPVAWQPFLFSASPSRLMELGPSQAGNHKISPRSGIYCCSLWPINMHNKREFTWRSQSVRLENPGAAPGILRGRGRVLEKASIFKLTSPPPPKKKNTPPPRSAAAYMQCTGHCWLDLSACLLSRMPAIYYFGPTLIVS